jgi:hypothetical protein
VQETVELAPDERLTLDGQDAETPEGAEAVRVTEPESPERLVRVTLPLPEDGGVKETDDAEMLKSRIVTGRVTE